MELENLNEMKVYMFRLPGSHLEGKYKMQTRQTLLKVQDFGSESSLQADPWRFPLTNSKA